MDSGVSAISELVVEACVRIDELERLPSHRVIGEIEHLRALLAVLGEEAGDDETADAARGVVRDIDGALASLRPGAGHRGAA